MPIDSIYAITDAKLLAEEDLFTGVEQALAAGIKTVQYRDKTSASAQIKANALRLQQLCSKYAAQLIINDLVDLAAEVGAAGVHLGRSDGSIRAARKRLGKNYIIGATCHNRIDWAHAARQEGADYVAFGRFYASSTKPDASLASIELLGQARRKIDLPLVAIGGIDQINAGIVFEAGAHSVAVCAGVFAASDIHQAALAMLAAVPAEH